MFLRKSWCPKTCKACGEPADPWRSDTKHWAGSYLWTRGTHLHCILKAHYGGFEDLVYQENTVSAFLTFIRHEVEEFSGGTFEVPLGPSH